MIGGAVLACRCSLSGREEEQALWGSFQGEKRVQKKSEVPYPGGDIIQGVLFSLVPPR